MISENLDETQREVSPFVAELGDAVKRITPPLGPKKIQKKSGAEGAL